jgi:hypothetical protein
MRHLTLSLLAIACAAETDPATEPATAPATLPSGTSTWSGEIEVAAFQFVTDVELDNDGGDLTAVVSFAAEALTGAYRVTGTYDPGSETFALVPENWTEEPAIAVEMFGMIGRYEDGALVGEARDTASGDDNTLYGGPLTLQWQSGSGAAVAVGSADHTLVSSDFSGMFRCSTATRPVEGRLDHDGNGGLTGTLTFADTEIGVDDIGTFELLGVHNPSTGGVTLVPDLWTATDRNFATFFVDLTHDGADGSLLGDTRINVGGCATDEFDVALQ